MSHLPPEHGRRWMTRKSERLLRWIIWIVLALFWTWYSHDRSILGCMLGLILLGALLLNHWGSRRIPVLTYHSVSGNGRWLNMPDLVMPLASFQRQMQWLQSRGYRTLSLDELYHLRRQKRIPPKAVALTFDDGYLDAWVAVMPVLRAHGLKGTVFVSSGWIESGPAPRPRLDQSQAKDLIWAGYLNASEIRLLKAGGVLDIQSHAHSHDRIFCDDTIVDFIQPGQSPLWVRLMQNPEDRTTWYCTQRSLPPGYPIFRGGEALATAAFFPSRELLAELTGRFAETGFFKPSDWKKTMVRTVDQYRRTHQALGRRETEQETHSRWRRELQQSRKILTDISGGTIDHLCWPRNAVHPRCRALAHAEGYLSTTAGNGHNGSSSPRRVSRVGISGIGQAQVDLWRMILEIWVFNGHYWAWPALWLIQRYMDAVFNQQPRENL